MDIKANEKLSNLLEQMKKESLVKGIEDLQVGDVVYYDMDWQAEQYLIRQVDYPEFLEYDSWIDCTDPKELKVSKIKAKNAEKKGRLNAVDLANVMRHLKENDFIDQHTRRVYGIDKFDATSLS